MVHVRRRTAGHGFGCLPVVNLALRPILVRLHRWFGLTLAGFLLLTGLTGSVLVWYEELDAWTNPRLLRVTPPAPDAPMLDPLALRQRVQALHPESYAGAAYLHAEPGHAAIVRLFELPAPATGETAELPNDQIFVNPYTGAVLGERKWGDITQGMKNLLPFIYRLHYSLASGTAGSTLLGIVALLWTLDCFVGAWLTFPAKRRRSAPHPRRPWLLRWLPAWQLRVGGGARKLSFDLHRAGGLWTWVMLLVLAWSSVAFNLHDEIYDPAMRTFFAHQAAVETLPRPQRLNLAPTLDWPNALETGRRIMAEQAKAHGFTVLNETLILHDPRRGSHGVYRYQVRSDRDIRDRWGSSQVIFDADTGKLLRLWLPTGAARGDTIRTWLTSLHMAALWGVPFRLFMSGMGLVVAALSVIGVMIWARKRRGRSQSRLQRRAAVAPRNPMRRRMR